MAYLIMSLFNCRCSVGNVLEKTKTFYVHGSVHRESVSIIAQQDATTQFIIQGVSKRALQI
jgi:hypothetical protein